MNTSEVRSSHELSVRRASLLAADGMANDMAHPRWGRIAREVIGPGLVLAVYCLALMVILPEGFNRRFVMFLALAACAAVATAVVVNAVSVRVWPDQAGLATRAEEPRRGDVWLLLLPLAPVVQYMVVNRDTLSALGSVVGTTLLAAFAVLLALVLPYLMRRAFSRSVMMMMGIALAFVMYGMASFARSNRWHGMEDATMPMVVFAAVLLGGVLLYRYRREAAYVVAGAYFVSSAVVVPLTSDVAPHARAEVRVSVVDPVARDAGLATIARGEAERLPDIIVLTYDSYVENETLLQYGIDNSEQEAYLESQGFEIERGTYSVAGDSISSMGRVLGGTELGAAVAGDSPLLEALSAAGYETSGVFASDYLFSRADPAYDHYFPDPYPSYLTMLRGIIEGRFRHDLALLPIPHDSYLAAKRAALAAEREAPEFIYSHGGPGHSQNAGVCLDNETELYEARLTKANLEMREDISTVLEHRPDAVVIVNGDHGPYLTKNCVGLNQYGGYDIDEVDRLDIQDRFGSFLAIRWPEDLAPGVVEIEVLQDMLPAVLGAIYADLDSDALRGEPRLAEGQEGLLAGVNIERGSIKGGTFDGEPLFEGAS